MKGYNKVRPREVKFSVVHPSQQHPPSHHHYDEKAEEAQVQTEEAKLLKLKAEKHHMKAD